MKAMNKCYFFPFGLNAVASLTFRHMQMDKDSWPEHYRGIVLLKTYFWQSKNSHLLIFSKLLLQVTFFIVKQRHGLFATSLLHIKESTSVPFLVTKSVCWIISFVCKTSTTIERKEHLAKGKKGLKIIFKPLCNSALTWILNLHFKELNTKHTAEL